MTVGQEVRILGGAVERTTCGVTVNPHHISGTSLCDMYDSSHKHVSKTPATKDDGNYLGAVLNAAALFMAMIQEKKTLSRDSSLLRWLKEAAAHRGRRMNVKLRFCTH